MSATARLRVFSLCFIVVLLLGASLIAPVRVSAEPTSGPTWTEGWCVKGQGISVVIDYTKRDKSHWPQGDTKGWQVHCIQPASAYDDATDKNAGSSYVGILEAAGFPYEESGGMVSSICGIAAEWSSGDWWVYSIDDGKSTPGWTSESPLPLGEDNNGRFMAATIGNDMAAFPVSPPVYAEPAPSPSPEPTPAPEDTPGPGPAPAPGDQGANSGAGNTGITDAGANAAVADNEQPSVNGHPSVHAAIVGPSASASGSASPSTSPSPSASTSSASPSSVWGGDATPKNSADQGMSLVHRWLLAAAGVIALGLIAWGAVVLYRMRKVNVASSASHAADTPEGMGADATVSMPQVPPQHGEVGPDAGGHQQSPW
ncbi:hypothetical protein [Propionibacterium freudenreichii]|uniref:hypothetical protein n=1 Tax=Propionibacterium freudenreichii TaxID=1744 RepID=UPI000AA8C1E6|nr:hypothetical protein [Propionibacterium freudenreichii]MDK9300081.1 hypothetical protein [Propionibacterium freudenreichii]MDK9319121.1 hypothetical protein [Propionibacterium freudenreichii]